MTEHRVAARSRHELAARYEAILKEIPDIVAEVDINKIYTWVNRAGYQFFGEDVIGKEASFFFDDERQDTYEKVGPLFDGSEETITLESWQRRRDGSRRLLAWWCRGLKDESGRVVGALSTARDITDGKRMEAALSESQQTVLALFENAAQAILWINAAGSILAFNAMADKLYEQFENLKKTDQLRRELVSNVSHDLRTPLATMHGYVETLLIKNDELGAEKRSEYLEIIRRHTQRLGELIGDLFELSKLDSASIHPTLEAFSLAELLHDTIHEFGLEAEKHNLDLSVVVPDDPSVVYADIGLVQRVLENLIRNAFKFTPDGGKISIQLHKKADAVAVAIEDTGCGMAAEDLAHIFDRFYRAENADQEGADSAGLGLAIVRRILDLHGSRITVSSQLERGTRFEFDLPTLTAA